MKRRGRSKGGLLQLLSLLLLLAPPMRVRFETSIRDERESTIQTREEWK